MTEPRTCAHCGTAEGELTEFNGRLYCEDCLDDLTLVCNDCGSRFLRTRNRSENDDFPICPECYDRDYTRCVRCGRIIATDHCWYPLDNDDPYCADCCSTIENSPIHDYYFKPYPIFYGDGPRYFGVELEIDDGGECDSSAETLMDVANQSKTLVYCKHDGSLDDGFEIVTHPMSLDCQLHEMPWAEVLDKAISMGYLSHQAGTCGLHVHVSRKAFGDALAACCSSWSATGQSCCASPAAPSGSWSSGQPATATATNPVRCWSTSRKAMAAATPVLISPTWIPLSSACSEVR